ncbi:zinc finger protein ZFP2-like [Malaya genurostris]|uniref:zinc finger protein ZFP2-like n=1 Tax=Malaya genurostris TaxID=325434 RepID=UPI0026F3FCCC|nr:zinc finger protein ZFP2-like [Malaya genurostris]
MSSHLVKPKSCRCCLAVEDEMFYVFEVAIEFGSMISELIVNCAGVSIADSDYYSKLICGNCLKDLHTATRFRRRCLETELVWKNSKTTYEMHESIVKIEEPIVKIEELCSTEEVIFSDHSSIQLADTKQKAVETNRNSDNSDSIQTVPVRCMEKQPVNNSSHMHSIANVNSLPTMNTEVPAVLETLGLKQVCDNKLPALNGQQSNSFAPPLKEQNDNTCAVVSAIISTTYHTEKVGDINKHDLKETECSKTTHLFKQQNHDRARLFKCDVCNREFYTVHHMTKHKRTHFDDRPHKCKVCGKGFLENSHLEYHKRTHTGERPYKCDLCEKQFLRSSHLTQHRRKHTDGQIHKCDLCGRGFPDSSALVRHKRSHTDVRPHKCDFCDKQFRSNSYLVLHRRIHTGEKPHDCKVCGKAFIEKSQLTQHVRIHTSERPHKCDICGKRFIQGGHLAQHKRIHLVE